VRAGAAERLLVRLRLIGEVDSLARLRACCNRLRVQSSCRSCCIS